MTSHGAKMASFLRARLPLRNLDAPYCVELLLVSSVASFLSIRAFLAATNYPQLGGQNAHIAHLLWGGLFMLVALLLCFNYHGRPTRRFCAFLGGLAFGAFIDEIGKYVTKTNNYFWKGSIAVIYIVFITIHFFLLWLRSSLGGVTSLNQEEALANALDLLKTNTGGQLDNEVTRTQILELLGHADPEEPLTDMLKTYVAIQAQKPASRSVPGVYLSLRQWLQKKYSKLVLHKWFSPLLVTMFVVQMITQVITIVLFFLGKQGTICHVIRCVSQEAPWVDGAQLTFAAISAILVLCGVWFIRKERKKGYNFFLWSVRVQVYGTQVFFFFTSQLAALYGLFFNLALGVAVSICIEAEEDIERLQTFGEEEQPVVDGYARVPSDPEMGTSQSSSEGPWRPYDKKYANLFSQIKF